jgi:lysophospholipase L1-like esterase
MYGFRSRWRALLGLFVLSILAAVIALAATKVVDVAVSFTTGGARSHGLIFPPNSIATYRTTEFQYTAKINSLGFRDREFGTIKSAKCRLMAIGDSFTFGWGVSVDESWPKVLQSFLGQIGFSVEVANLGFPGGNPADYANVASAAIPILKPELVIVGLLQGDDVASAGAAPRIGSPQGSGFRWVVEGVAKAFYPHLLALLASRNYRTAALGEASVGPTWAEQVSLILAGFGTAEKAKYAQIDRVIRSNFESGNLNPSIIFSAIHRPDYFIEAFDLEQPHTQELVRKMSLQLSRIRDHAAQGKAEVVFVSVPFGLYVSQQQFDVRQKGFGFKLVSDMLSSSAPDEAIRRSALSARVPFLAFTEAFRKMGAAGTSLFFTFDGHFNASGHRAFAELLTPAVAATLNALPSSCRGPSGPLSPPG